MGKRNGGPLKEIPDDDDLRALLNPEGPGEEPDVNKDYLVIKAFSHGKHSVEEVMDDFRKQLNDAKDRGYVVHTVDLAELCALMMPSKKGVRLTGETAKLCRILDGPNEAKCSEGLFGKLLVQFQIFEGYETTMTFEISEIKRNPTNHTEVTLVGMNAKGNNLELYYNVYIKTGHFYYVLKS